MEFFKDLIYNDQGQVQDIFAILADINTKLTDWAAQINVPSMVMFIAGIVLAAIIGMFGYKLIRLLMGVVSAVAGYFVGAEIFFFIEKQFNLKLHIAFAYVAAGVCALLLFALAFKLFSYAMYLGVAALGYAVASFYLGQDMIILALAVGIIVALIAVLFSRFSFALITSVASGYFIVSMAAGLFPKVEYFDLSKGVIPLSIGGGLALLFLLIQLFSTHHRRHSAPAAQLALAKGNKAERKAAKAEKKAAKAEKKLEEKRRLAELKALQANGYRREPMFLGFSD